MSTLSPGPEHRFSFGLWTVGHRGGDPFGGPTRPPLDPSESVRQLAELGVWGVSLHDDDLVPPDATSSERRAIIGRFQRALEQSLLLRGGRDFAGLQDYDKFLRALLAQLNAGRSARFQEELALLGRLPPRRLDRRQLDLPAGDN